MKGLKEMGYINVSVSPTNNIGAGDIIYVDDPEKTLKEQKKLRFSFKEEVCYIMIPVR